ncbi:MAG: hypothetical protein IT435_14555 [Phycisphaerales bacterium]|nr:hypothetical protein [Phycisphaerales bacterium]
MPDPGRTCIVNVSVGSWYPLGQQRMLASMRTHSVDAEPVVWANSYPCGSPTHQEVPFAFKTYAIQHARSLGFDRVLWLDSSLIALRWPRRLYESIEKHGVFVSAQKAHMLGEWASDACLAKLGMSREESMTLHSADASCIGLDFRHEVARRFFERWREASMDGVSFPGPRDNDAGQASADRRVKGHRWDQTAAGIIAYQLQIPLFRWNHSMTRHGDDFRLNERADFQARRVCSPRELRGAIGTALWRLRQKLAPSP